MLVAVAASGKHSGVCVGLRGALRDEGEHGFFEPDGRNGEMPDGISIWFQSSGDGFFCAISVLCRPPLHERLDVSPKSSCP